MICAEKFPLASGESKNMCLLKLKDHIPPELDPVNYLPLRNICDWKMLISSIRNNKICLCLILVRANLKLGAVNYTAYRCLNDGG